MVFFFGAALALTVAQTDSTLTKPVSVKSNDKFLNLTVDGEFLSVWKVTDKPIDFYNMAHHVHKDSSEICLVSEIDRACHTLTPGQTGVWVVQYDGKDYVAHLKR